MGSNNKFKIGNFLVPDERHNHTSFKPFLSLLFMQSETKTSKIYYKAYDLVRRWVNEKVEAFEAYLEEHWAYIQESTIAIPTIFVLTYLMNIGTTYWANRSLEKPLRDNPSIERVEGTVRGGARYIIGDIEGKQGFVIIRSDLFIPFKTDDVYVIDKIKGKWTAYQAKEVWLNKGRVLSYKLVKPLSSEEKEELIDKWRSFLYKRFVSSSKHTPAMRIKTNKLK